jgi:hypothetical protein
MALGLWLVVAVGARGGSTASRHSGTKPVEAVQPLSLVVACRRERCKKRENRVGRSVAGTVWANMPPWKISGSAIARSGQFSSCFGIDWMFAVECRAAGCVARATAAGG